MGFWWHVHRPPLCASTAAVPKVQAKQRFNAHPVLAIIRQWSSPSGITLAASQFMCPVNAAKPRQRTCPNAAKLRLSFQQGGDATHRHCWPFLVHLSCNRAVG